MKIPTIEPRMIPLILWIVCGAALFGLGLAWLNHVERSGVKTDLAAQDSIQSLRTARIASDATRDSLAAVFDSVETHRQAELASALAREAEADARASEAATEAERLNARLSTMIDSTAQVVVDSIQMEHGNEVVALQDQIVLRDGRIEDLQTSLILSKALHVQRDTLEASLRAEIVQHEQANVGLRSALAASNASRSLQRNVGLGTLAILAVVVLR